MQDYRDVIIRPVLTEQSVNLIDNNNAYTFQVAKNTNKIEVRQAVENLFGVKVKKVNILNTKDKKVRRGRYEGVKHGYKKAVVFLADGDKIDILGEEE